MVICIPISIAMQHDSLSYTAEEHGSAVTPLSSRHSSAVLNKMIPPFLQRRLTSVQSLRQIAAAYIRPSNHERHSSCSSDSSNSLSPPPPPPPPYSEEPPTDDEDADMEFASAPSTRPSSSDSSTPHASRQTLAAGQQGHFAEDLVRYKFANQGLLLVAQSAQELRNHPEGSNEYQRRLYLDGITYLLRALPEGLSEQERAGLQAALPGDMRQDHTAIEEAQTRKDESRKSGRSALSSVIAAIVFWTFLAVATALPYIRSFSRLAYEFERRHKLGEQCLHRTMILMHVTYAQVLALLCAIWAVNDGIVGRKLTELSVWFAESAGEGVRDGLREAALALGRNQDDR